MYAIRSYYDGYYLTILNMKVKDRFFKKTRLMFVSPWLLAAAIGLLSLIIVIFAANNIKRERGMLTEGLFRKGEAIFRFVEAGMRASMIRITSYNVCYTKLLRPAGYADFFLT